MVKKKIYIQNKNKTKMLYSKINKKISLGEYSSLRKKKEKTISIQVIIRKHLGLNRKRGVNNKGSKGMLMVIQA